VDVPTFRLHFPEFAQSDQTYVTAKLSEAAVRMGGNIVAGPARIWGCFAPSGSPPTIADMAQGNLAAHYLISGPYGTELRLDPKGNGRSQYLDKYEELERAQCGPAAVVAGGRRRFFGVRGF
jgi:hypothetical protein